MILTPTVIDAEETGWRDVRFRFGLSENKGNQDYKFAEVAGTYGLPYEWQLDSEWPVLSGLDVSAALLKPEKDEYSVIGSVGPAFLFKTPVRPVSVIASVRAALMSDHKIGDEDLGGAFTLIEEIGVRFRLDDRFFLEYSYQHISNAGLYNNNPGVDLHILGIRYEF